MKARKNNFENDLLCPAWTDRTECCKRVQGRINSDLTALGQMQAYITGQYFSDQQIHFDAVYRSPLERCKDTAMLICPYKQSVAMDGFIETGYGKLEGSSVDEFQKVKGKYSNSAFVKKFGGRSGRCSNQGQRSI